MRRAELSAGDVVFVILPYEGGKGWATVTEPEYFRPDVQVEFIPQRSSGVHWQLRRLVRPARIIRKETA